MRLPIERGPGDSGLAVKIGFHQSDLSDPQQIHYEILQDGITIDGGSSRSLLYAVYEFAERELGVRFYTPDYTHYPKISDRKLQEKQFDYAPPITTRTVHSRLFYEHPEFADKLKVTHEAFPGYVPTARVHTFHRFMPAKDYMPSHPEYYALRNGNRLSTQLCLTHPEVLNIVTQEVGKYFEQYPDKPIISVSQDDNTQYCQCDRCASIDSIEGSPAGTMINFVNQIARAFPDKTISTLAYQYTRKAPKNLKPEPNVLVTLCSIECDRSAPIRSKCQDFTRDLQEWGEITDNVRIWDYTTQFTNFLAPFPNLWTLQPNIQLFLSNNARWIFEQHSHQPSELFELRSYLTAKLLWDPELRVDSMMNDFLSGYYGPAGSYIQQYIDHVHTALAQDSSFFLFLYGDPSQGFASFLSADNLLLYNQWFDRAVQSVKDNDDQLRRVEAARLSVDYATLEAIRKGISPAFDLSNTDEVQDRLERFRRVTTQHDITMMNEMRFTVEEYLQGYASLLNRASRPNNAKGKSVKLLTQPKKYAGEDPQTLTDGAFGGSSFYANWLGFEGNDLEAVIDLGSNQKIQALSTAFLQVVNHIVFFPEEVSWSISTDGSNFKPITTDRNPKPLNPQSKINDIWNIRHEGLNVQGRYLKIQAKNKGVAPAWHHGADLPSWIFIDEVGVE